MKRMLGLAVLSVAVGVIWLPRQSAPPASGVPMTEVKIAKQRARVLDLSASGVQGSCGVEFVLLGENRMAFNVTANYVLTADREKHAMRELLIFTLRTAQAKGDAGEAEFLPAARMNVQAGIFDLRAQGAKFSPMRDGTFTLSAMLATSAPEMAGQGMEFFRQLFRDKWTLSMRPTDEKVDYAVQVEPERIGTAVMLQTVQCLSDVTRDFQKNAGG